MKFYQQAVFNPIGFVLESADEANALWDLARFATDPSCLTPQARAIAIDISNMFSNQAQMEGEEE